MTPRDNTRAIDDMTWEAEITLYREGKVVGTADVSAETYDDLIHQATSEMADWQRREA